MLGGIAVIFQVFLDTLRLKGAVLFPDNAAPTDVFFQPRSREYYFREHKAVRKKGIYSWSSAASGRINARLDYLTRLVKNIGAPISVDVAVLHCGIFGIDLSTLKILRAVGKTSLHRSISRGKELLTGSGIIFGNCSQG